MNKTGKKALAVGAGVAALAAAAAGTYFFAGKGGAKNRAKVKKWAHDAKKEVIKQVEGLPKVTKQTYDKAVDAALTQYKNLKNIDKAEFVTVAKELKSHWDSIQKDITKAAKPVAKKVANVTKTVGKKITTASKPKPKAKKKK